MTRILVLTLLFLGPAAASGRMQGATFDLKAWNIVGDANWTVAGDVVQADSGSGFLVTPAAYGDFEVSVEVWVNDEANSGHGELSGRRSAVGGGRQEPRRN